MSAIQWTDATRNPVIGCSKVSAGCRDCYASDTAASLAHRFPNGVGARYLQVLDDTGKRWNGRTFVDRAALQTMKVPRRKRTTIYGPTGVVQEWRAARVFLGSMTDMFHETLSAVDLAPVWAWMGSFGGQDGPIFQIVTKRPHRAREILPQLMTAAHGRILPSFPRIHLLTSTEDQEAADLRVSDVLACRPWVELVGLSMEPLLGPVVLRPEWLIPHHGLSWVIIGGESGDTARPCRLDWIADIVRQCERTGTAVFVKQLGCDPMATINGADAPWPTHDPKGGDPAEWPLSLRVREFPT